MPESVESLLEIEKSAAPAVQDARPSPMTAPLSIVVESGLFSFNGRIGRGSYWARIIFGNLIFFVVGMLAGVLISQTRAEEVGLLLIPLFVANLWFALAQQVKRWHDLDQSGLMVLLNFTIIFIPVAFILLGFVPGTIGSNRYGAQS